MLLRAALVATALAIAITSSPGNTSIDKGDSQVVTQGQLQEIVNHLQDNSRILKKHINRIGVAKIKLPSIKQFLGKKLKLKGFLTQIYFKVVQEGAKLAISLD